MQRLDGGCHAQILHAGDEILFVASWPATSSDARNFHVANGIAYNTVSVPREYFERRYGVVP